MTPTAPVKCLITLIILTAIILIILTYLRNNQERANPCEGDLKPIIPRIRFWDSDGFTPQYLPLTKKTLVKRDLNHESLTTEHNTEESPNMVSRTPPSDQYDDQLVAGELNATTTIQIAPNTTTAMSDQNKRGKTNTKRPVTSPSELPTAQKFREIRHPVQIPTRSLTIHSTTPSTMQSTAPTLTGLFVLTLVIRPVIYVHPNSVPLTTLMMSSILGKSAGTYLTVFDSAGRFTSEELDSQSISLLGVDDCSSVANSYKKPIEQPVQVLYQTAESILDVLQCHIKVTTRIYPCHSDIFRSDTYPAILLHPPHIISITDAECRDLYKSKRFAIDIQGYVTIIDDFTRHEQTKVTVLSGERLTNGACSGSPMTIDNVRHKNAILEAEIKYFTRKVKGKYLPSNNLIYVSNLLTYPIDQPSCDAALGCFYVEDPEKVPKDSCEMTQQVMTGLGKLFVPNAEQTASKTLGYVEIMQILSNDDPTQGVTLTLESTKFLCGRMVRLTNVPHVYVNVLKDTKSDLISHRLIIDAEMEKSEQQYLDLLSSSSSLYLAGSLDTAGQFDQISHKICSLRRSALLGLLRDMLISSPHMLLNYFEGLLFLRRASTITIYAGNPLPAQLRMTTSCYDEIPVLIKVDGKDTPMFATSKGRILVDNATQVPCSPAPMHYIMSEPDELLKLNRTVKNAFIALAFGELHNQLTRGGWICQSPETFVSCSGPVRLSPLIKENDHFFHGLGSNFIHRNLFGDKKRENLFKSQSMGYEREAFLAQITDSAKGGHQGLMRAVIRSMPSDIQQQLREKLMPTFYLVIGDLTNYIEEFLIATFVLSVILNLLKMLLRVRIIFYKHGWSKHLLSAVFEGIWGIFMPWHSAKFHRQELEAMMSQRANQLGAAQHNETIKMERVEQRVSDLEGHRTLDYKKLVELTLEVSNVRESMHRPPIFDRLKDIAPVNSAPPPKYDLRSANDSQEEDDYTPLIK